MEPIVTIIIPVYNAEKFLEECINSVINQTLKNIEIMLIDDGSKDDSLKICRKFEKEDKRIRVISKRNEGASITRNYGIKQANGKYISFLDCDDYIDSDYLEKLYNKMEEFHLDVCYTEYKRFNSSDKSILYKGNNIYCENKRKMPKLNEVNKYQYDFVITSVCMGMYKKDIIKNNNIEFFQTKEHEDLIFNIDYLNHVNTFMIINSVYYYYRFNENSVTQSYEKERFEQSKRIYNFLIEKLKNYNIYNRLKKVIANIFIGSVRYCIKEEISNNKNYRNTIKDMINDKVVNEAVRIKGKQKFKQNIFDYFIKMKNYRAIILLEKLNNKK